MFDAIIRHIQVCIPFRLLKDKYLPMVIENRINPEIGMDGEALDSSSQKDLSMIASALKREDLSVTLHAPFFDLAPGAMDSIILSATRKRLMQMFELVPLFEPKSIVCHTGYDRKRYNSDKEKWLETALETWVPLVEKLDGMSTVLVLENVYEKTPNILLELLGYLDESKTGFCFDTGHMNAFSETNIEGWLNTLGPFIKQLHLHDNDGSWDHHWAIGAGKIHFEVLFRFVSSQAVSPIITLEAHHEDWLWQSLEALSRSHHFIRLISKS